MWINKRKYNHLKYRLDDIVTSQNTIIKHLMLTRVTVDSIKTILLNRENVDNTKEVLKKCKSGLLHSSCSQHHRFENGCLSCSSYIVWWSGWATLPLLTSQVVNTIIQSLIINIMFLLLII